MRCLLDVLDNGYNGAKFDCIFSCNFLPVISKASYLKKIKYISWCYDSPCMTLYSDMIYNPYNYIFHFDSYEVNRLCNVGVNHIYHMPLAVNTKRVNNIIENRKVNDNIYSSDITFMGNIYSTINDYDNLYKKSSDYLKGQFDAILDINELFQGMDLLDEMIDDSLMSYVKETIQFTHFDEFNISDADIVKNIIGRKVSGRDRIRILTKLSQKYKIDLYTTTKMNEIKNIYNKGILDYYNNVPVVFCNSKINLNIYLRTIRNGIPLRAMDIMGAGGFLISNYQKELDELFIDGEDMVLYYNDNDLILKVDYYLSHDEERRKIAANGKKKIIDMFAYKNVWDKIFEICGLV